MVDSEARVFRGTSISKGNVAAVIAPQIEFQRVVRAENFPGGIKADGGDGSDAAFVNGEFEPLSRAAGIGRWRHKVSHAVVAVSLRAVVEGELSGVVIGCAIAVDGIEGP